MSQPNMKIWVRSENSRVYRRDGQGKPYGAPIERERWQAKKVVSETSRSWVLSDGRKVPKSTRFPTAYLALTEQQVDDVVWFSENAHQIARAVHALDYGLLDPDKLSKLREVAKAIGYIER